jgi:ABC-2 type transport system ATP-binding protein
MSTLINPDSGTVVVDGLDVVDSNKEVRRRIGLAGQFASVDEIMSGRENIEMVGRLYHIDKETVRKRATEILERFNLTDAADRLVNTYSGGMRRRLDLGASLVGEPKVLFLDEPTTGLDPRTRLELWSLIRELNNEGTTILLTTQYLDEADELADYISIIDQGKLISEGTADELKNKLGNDIVEVILKDGGSDSETAMKVISKVAKRKPKLGDNGRTIRLQVLDGSKSLMRIVKALDEAKIEPAEVSLHRPTLDDVFLKLTGKKTEAAK